jgi:hypothetical protein
VNWNRFYVFSKQSEWGAASLFDGQILRPTKSRNSQRSDDFYFLAFVEVCVFRFAHDAKYTISVLAEWLKTAVFSHPLPAGKNNLTA